MEDDSSLLELCVEEDVVQTLCNASNSSTLEESLEKLTELSRSDNGREELGRKEIAAATIRLVQSLPYPSSGRELLLHSLRLLRNLCAGEIANQDSFVARSGVVAISSVLRSAVARPNEADEVIVRLGLQILANVSLAGEDHQRAIRNQFFPREFLALARIRSRLVGDPLCLVLYACCDGNIGLPIAREIVRTTCSVGFGEDWLKLILSKMCLEQPNLSPLFSELSLDNKNATGFSEEQAFLLRMASEILNERIEEKDFSVSNVFASCVLEIFKLSVNIVDFNFSSVAPRTVLSLPTGFSEIDVLGYSLTILRDLCAHESSRNDIDSLISSGLVEMLLSILRDLEPPATIKKAMEQQKQNPNKSLKPCPYKGFRRDIVAVIGNCVYGRKHIQDDIRNKNAILLLLQQCVTDDDNPFLREWGIWCVRNLLGGNVENQQAVAELELQGSVDSPELAGLGLRVEVDTVSGRAKLVNIPSMRPSSD